MGDRPRFVVDVMLGRLAKWLRLLGYDTLYFNESEDHDLARLARAENRILLTRDVELTKRRGVHSLLVENEFMAEQFRQVLRQLHLESNEAFSRCPECNVPLPVVEREQLRSKIPPYVYHTYTRFRQCPNCERVFWRGTHWATIVAQIDDMTQK